MILLASLPTSLPFTDPVLIFGLAMILVLLAPILIRLLKLPSIVGLIAAGMLVGPNAIGLLERDATIVLLGTVGLLYLMFMAGLEIDLNEFARSRGKSVTFGLLSFLLPQGVGTLLGFQLGLETASAVLLGSVLASHTLLAFPIASRLRIGKIESSTMAVGGTIITDVLALFVLAVVLGSQEGELTREFWISLLGSLTLYTLAVFLIVPRLGRWFFRRADADPSADYIFSLAVLFVCSFLAEVIGIEHIIGAFFAGLALNRLIPESSTLMNRINFVGNALFIPFFLLSVGMLVDVRVFFESVDAIVVAIGMSATVLLTKLAAAWLSRWMFGFSKDEGWVIFGLSIPQAAATLAATLIGYDLGLFEQSVVNGVIVMILVTCVTGPAVVERFGVRVAEAEAARVQAAGGHALQRILIPLRQTHDVEEAIAFATALRDHHSEEALYPIQVVPDDASTAEVASAERLLAEAEHAAAATSIPVSLQTRSAANAATGIARAILDQRISSVVLPWSGDVREGATFGAVIDGVLRESACEVFIVRITSPLAATKRCVIAVQPGSIEHDGFRRAVESTKKLALQLGASVLVLTIAQERARIEAAFTEVVPASIPTFVDAPDLATVTTRLQENLTNTDIAVVLGSREALGTPDARSLIGQLCQGVSGNCVVQIAPEPVRQQQTLDADKIESITANTTFVVQKDADLRSTLLGLLEMELHLDDALPEALVEEVLAHATQVPLDDALVLHLHSARVPYAASLIALQSTGSTPRAIALVLTPDHDTHRSGERRSQDLADFLAVAVPALPAHGAIDIPEWLARVRSHSSASAA